MTSPVSTPEPWPDHSDPEIAALMLKASKDAERRYGGILPDHTTIGKRRYGRYGFKWRVSNGTCTSLFPREDQDAAWREAWWLAWCEDDYRDRQAAS